MAGTHPKASAEYAQAREELLEAELALRDQRERVAELRRALPRDTRVDDEIFEEIRDGERVAVRLAELFEDSTKRWC